jgi:hypothetical protein
MSRRIAPLRIVSALSANWDNTVTSIQSILELIKKESEGGEIPSEALLFCDCTEKRKIEEKIGLGVLKDVLGRMGLEVEITEVPTINEIYDEGLPYLPRDGDIINTRPGSGLYPALMMNSVAGYLQGNKSIVFYLAEVSPTGASMTWSRVFSSGMSEPSTITTKEYELSPQDNLIRILINGGAKKWDEAPGRVDYNKTKVDAFKSIESDPDSDGATISYYLEQAYGKTIGYEGGTVFEELTGYELAHHCGNIDHVVCGVEFPREAKTESGRMAWRREDDAIALSAKGNLICFSCKFLGPGNTLTPGQIRNVAKAIDVEIHKLEAFPFPGANPRQRVYNVLVTTTTALNFTTNAKGVIVTNLEGLSEAIKDL